MKWILHNLGTCSIEETLESIKKYQTGIIVVDARDIPDDKCSGEDFERLKKHIVIVSLLRKRGYRVLVRCHAGISRSNSIAIAVIMLDHKMIFEDALDLVKTKIPEANPHPELLDNIKDAVKEIGIQRVES